MSIFTYCFFKILNTLFHSPRLLGKQEYIEDFLAKKKLTNFGPLLK